MNAPSGPYGPAGPAPAGLDILLSRFDKVRSAGPDRWSAICPAHEDKSPSLSIRLTDDRILLHCHTGCAVEDIVGAMGLEMRYLFLLPLEHQRLREMARAGSTRNLEEAIAHELDVIAMTLGARVTERQIPRDRMP
jgi:hypothetical protein